VPVIIDQFDLVDTRPDAPAGGSDSPPAARTPDADSAVTAVRIAADRAARVRAD
jgi:hypothetical protein